MKPNWIKQKEKLNKPITEQIEFVGSLGVSGVIDGKLPNGDTYEWSKKHRRKLKKPKS